MKTGTADEQAMLADHRRALVVALLLLAGAATLYVLVWSTSARSDLQWVDDRFLRLVERLRFGPAVSVAKAFDLLGATWCTWTLRVAAMAILFRRRHWLHLTAFALTVATSEALVGTSKALLDRPRPVGSLVGTSGASFPSGHAIAAAVTAVGLVIALLPAGRQRWKWEWRAALFASLMALSRTYLGAHWLSDVVAGALLGSGLAIGWPAVLVLARDRHRAGGQRPGLREWQAVDVVVEEKPSEQRNLHDYKLARSARRIRPTVVVSRHDVIVGMITPAGGPG